MRGMNVVAAVVVGTNCVYYGGQLPEFFDQRESVNQNGQYTEMTGNWCGKIHDLYIYNEHIMKHQAPKTDK